MTARIYIDDMKWIGLSIILVWVYITFHVGSLFLGLAGII